MSISDFQRAIGAAKAFTARAHVSIVTGLADRASSLAPSELIADAGKWGSDIGGRAVVRFASHAPAVDLALETLERLSPEYTGAFKASHEVFVNGAAVDWPVQVEPRDKIKIVNTTPYARRIERGWSDSAPDGVYEVAASLVAARFEGIRVRFSYQGVPGDAYERNPAMEFSLK